MKKILATMIATAMMVSLVSCSSGTTTSTSTTTSTESGSSSPEHTLSIGFTTSAVEYDPYYVTSASFKEQVEAMSDGRIAVEIYGGGTLGSEIEMFESMQSGTLDMGVITNAYVSAYVTSNGCLDLPFVFADYDQARTTLDSEFGEKLLAAMDGSGVTGLGWSEGGFRQLVTGSKAVAAPDDLQGMKIRCMETKTYLAAYASLGVNATPMAWSETVTALQQGTIDGMDIPVSVIYANGFPDVADYVDMISLFYSPLVVCIADSTLAQFSEEDQQLLRDAATAAGVVTRANNDAWEADMLVEMEEDGITIVSDVDMDAFQAKASSCYENAELREYIGAEYVDELLSIVGLA